MKREERTGQHRTGDQRRFIDPAEKKMNHKRG